MTRWNIHDVNFAKLNWSIEDWHSRLYFILEFIIYSKEQFICYGYAGEELFHNVRVLFHQYQTFTTKHAEIFGKKWQNV